MCALRKPVDKINEAPPYRPILYCPPSVYRADDFVPGLYRWVVDWSVAQESRHKTDKGSKRVAPPGFHRQCQGIKRRTRPRKQCPLYATPGYTTCQYHRHNDPNVPRYRPKMTRYYSGMSKALGDLLESHESTPEQELSVLEELRLARVIAGEAVRRFDGVCVSPTKDGKAPSAGLKSQVSYLAMEAMKNVVSLSEKAAKIRATNGNVVDAEHFEYIKRMLSRSLLEVLPEDKAQEVLDHLNTVLVPMRNLNKDAANASAQDILAATREMRDASRPAPPD